MKLLVVAPYFYPKIGGMENYAFTISKGLKQKYGWKIVVITSNHSEKKYKEEIIQGIKIYRLPTLFKISNTPVNPFWIFTIKKIIAKEKPDIINAHSPVPFIADVSKFVSGKIPFVLTYHAGKMLKSKWLADIGISTYEASALKYLFQKSDKIICYTKEFIDSTLQPFKDKVIFIPPGVDTKIFTPTRNYNKNKVLFVARIERSSEWKGLYYLLDAMKIVIERNNEAILEIVGTGDAVEDYKLYVNSINIHENVTFLGPLKGRYLAEVYKNTSVLVLPSTSTAESFGIVLVEAMASGIPVIGSNIGGIPNVIDDDINGLLVEPRDSKDLAEAILQILNDKKNAIKLGQSGLKKVEDNYTWEKQINKSYKILKL